ncbi:MAG TPA: hypothetical protein VHF25_04065 [Nitriliruptorales bacterium]|nr:hypothetical protein [Nitriliruptorales bacterium]
MSATDDRFEPSRRQPGDPWGRRERPPSRFAAYDVIATLPDMSAARRVVQALQMAGIDASQISLFGPAADEAAADLGVRQADAAFAGVMWRRTWVGGLVGAAFGALAGAIAGGLVLHGTFPDSLGVLLAAIAGTAVLGLGTGAATGATSAAQMSRAWELTFHRVAPGQVGVGVHSDRSREADRAVAVLRRHRPTQLERFDPSGR